MNSGKPDCRLAATSDSSPQDTNGTKSAKVVAKNFVPQIGQVRWGSALMDLTVLQPQPEWRCLLY